MCEIKFGVAGILSKRASRTPYRRLNIDINFSSKRRDRTSWNIIIGR